MMNSTVRPTVSDYLRQIETAALSLPNAVARSAEYAGLAGEDGRDVYKEAIDRISRALGVARRDLLALRDHRHEWSDEDYCAVCGADGRA